MSAESCVYDFLLWRIFVCYVLHTLFQDVLEDLSIPGRRFSLYLGHDTGPANSLTDTLQLKCKHASCVSV